MKLLTPFRARVLRGLDVHGPQSVRALASRLGADGKWVARALRALEADGLARAECLRVIEDAAAQSDE